MITACAWCDPPRYRIKILWWYFWITDDVFEPGPGEVTHGMCPKHYKIERRKLAEYRAKRLKERAQ